MARCKPDDLAVIIRDPDIENIGQLVRVLRPAGDHYYIPENELGRLHWECEVLGRVKTIWPWGTGWTERGGCVACLDADLRPIRDPGKDATDEMVERLGSPYIEHEPEGA